MASERRHERFHAVVIVFVVAKLVHEHSSDGGVERRSQARPTTRGDVAIVRTFRGRSVMEKGKQILRVIVDKVLNGIELHQLPHALIPLRKVAEAADGTLDELVGDRRVL